MNNEAADQRAHTPRTLRVLTGMSREALSQESGVSARTIAMVESGGNTKLETLEKIALALGIETVELVQALEHERKRRAS